LNGSSASHGSPVKKKKAAKSELSPSQRLHSAASVDNGDGVVDKKPCSEFVPVEEKCCSSPSPADEDMKPDPQQLVQATQSTALVRYGFLLA